jgi:signal peptidase II
MQAARGTSLSHGDKARRRRLRALLFGCAALVYLLDVVTKHLAVSLLDPGRPVEVVGDVLRLTLVRNPGAAFSAATSFTVVLSLVAVAAVITVLVLSRRVGSPAWALALGLLLGGVAGNLTDRVFRSPGVLRGHVVDFLQLPSWPVFNIADMAINAAAALIVIQALRGRGIDGRAVDEERGGRGAVEEPPSAASGRGPRGGEENLR